MKKKVLVVDDDTSLLDAMTFMLTVDGYEVATNKGKRVIEAIHRHHPDIILLDVLLSGGDGRKICKEIKEKKNLQSLPIILLSAHPSAGKTYKEYGADAFMAKPFDNKDLLTLIDSLTN